MWQKATPQPCRDVITSLKSGVNKVEIEFGNNCINFIQIVNLSFLNAIVIIQIVDFDHYN